MLTDEKQPRLVLNKTQKIPYMRPKSKPNLKKDSTVISTLFLTDDIHFSQASISPRFRNGALISDLSVALLGGDIKVSDIACIRVVYFQEKWLTLDNRRLRAFKDAMLTQIPAEICSLNNPEIYREFHDKQTNRSSNGGGVVRRPQGMGSTQHFEGGIFTFVKRILNLSFAQLAQPIPSLQRIPSLASRFQSANEYYQSFLELIVEEARASLQAGIEAAVTDENIPFKVTLQMDYKPPKNYQNPAPLTFTKKPNERRPIKANDAFLLSYRTEDSNIQLLGLASVAPSEDLSQIQLKVVTQEEDVINTPLAFQTGAKWLAKPIGSLVTHLRMFDVCMMRPNVLWIDNLLSGDLKKNSDFKNPPLAFQLSGRLNASQQEAVDKFLKLERGIQLVQGPPGTGKTTMVIGLLASLVQQGRTLVCAPSNKAVQILAERFASEYPNVPAILAGVEDKIPEDNLILRQMFIHTWGNEKLKAIAHLIENLWTLFPSPLFEGNLKNRVKKLENAILKMDKMTKDFAALLPDFKKYKLDILTDAHIENFTKIAAQYVQHITTKGLSLARKKIVISKKDLDMPKTLDPTLVLFFDETRAILTEIATLLSQIELTLSLKINDDSSTGLEAELLKQSIIIFTTLSVSGRKQLQEMPPVNTLIIDEAGQAVEAETLIPLVTRPQKCLLIGDTNQLPATVISQPAIQLGFDRSLMQRLLKDCDQPYSILTTQYRMHPEIRFWPTKQYYQSNIIDSDEIASGIRTQISTKEIPPFIAPYAFIHVEGQETKIGRSFKNQQEADSILRILHYLKNHLSLNVAARVGIITFYKGQATLLNEKVTKIFPGVKVNTVDSFQGDENDLIIISSVRSNTGGKIGFLNDFRRLNVALTRAKHGLMIVGNADTLEKEKHDLALLVSDAKTRKCFYHYDAIKVHLEPKPKLLAFDANRAKKLKSPTHTLSQSNVAAIDNLPKTATSAENYASAPKQLTTNSHKIRNKTKICSFDQKNPDSCRKGLGCDFLHGNNQQALSIHTEQRKLSRLPEMNLEPATSTTISTIASKATTPTTTPAQKSGATTLTTTPQATTSTRKPGSPASTQATNSASEKRVNGTKREGSHQPSLPKMQPKSTKGYP